MAHSDDAVLACADPSVGIAAESERIPTMKQLTDFLQRRAAAIEITKRIENTKATTVRRVVAEPLGEVPNIFIAENIVGYDRMVERHNATTKAPISYYERRACHDGETRLGLWVPLAWWEDGGRKTPRTWERPPAKEIVDDLAGL